MKLTCALVGQHHRPPARQVLDVLPLGIKLEVRPEPTNEFDPNALMVVVDMGDLPVDRIPLLDTILPEPWDASELCASGDLHLGYIARSGGKPAKGLPGNAEVLDLAAEHGWQALNTTLGSALEGFPVVVIEAKE